MLRILFWRYELYVPLAVRDSPVDKRVQEEKEVFSLHKTARQLPADRVCVGLIRSA